MNAPSGEQPIRRVVVALDASPHSWAALTAAARLAASLHAELVALFVEDIDLLHMADTPITREVGGFSARVRQLDSQQMERQLRAVARRIRQRVAQTAAQVQITWTFQVRRGRIAEELMAAVTTETDLLSLGRLGWPLSRHTTLGSTAQHILRYHRTPVLLTHQAVSPEQPIVVAYDGTEAANRALDMAAHLARIYENELIVLVPTQNSEAAESLRQQAIERLARQHIQAGFQRIDSLESTALLQLLRNAHCGLLVLARRYFEELDELSCAVLLVP